MVARAFQTAETFGGPGKPLGGGGSNEAKPAPVVLSGGEGSDTLLSGSGTDRLIENAERVQTVLEQIGESFEGFDVAAGDAFAEFILGTGRAEDAFKAFAASVLSQIAQIIARQLVLNAISGLFGGQGGFLGSVFGGARADGGPVQRGRTFLVGERGPELFTPDMNGSIIPNDMLASGQAGAVGTTLVFNAPGASKTDLNELKATVTGLLANRDMFVKETFQGLRRDGRI